MIYIAGPFFNDSERTYLNEMIERVKQIWPDQELFIPMEHFIEDGEEMSNKDWAYRVFDMDVQALTESDFVVALYMGHYSDTGTAWELEYAFGLNKNTYLYIPDEYVKQDMSIMPVMGSSVLLNQVYDNLIQK